MLYAVALLLDVGAVEEGVGLVAAGLAQEGGGGSYSYSLVLL